MTPAPGPAAHVSSRQIATGAAWLVLFKFLDKSVGLVSTVILTRILLPADFGLVAMATAVVAFTQLMSAFGFDSALIQRQSTTRLHFDTAWTFNVIFGVAIATVLCGLALPLASFYGEPRLMPILLVLAAGAALGGFENIGTVAFRKELDFRSEFRFLLLKRLASFTVTVALAIWLRSYWALVAGTVTSRLVSVWISYRLHPYRPRLTLAARKDLMHFSQWIFLSSLLQFFHSRMTDFVLGRTVGPHGLGVYNIASEIAAMPSSEMIAPLNRVVFPAYARLSGDIGALRERFLQVFGMISLVALPVSAVLYAVADPAVQLVLGPNWLEAIPLIQIFALTGLLSALSSNLYLVVVAMGRPQANTLLSGAVLLVSLPTVVWASMNYGVTGAAFAQMLASILAFAGILTVFTRLVRVSLSQLVRVTYRPFVSSLILLALLSALDAFLSLHAPIASSPLLRLLLLLPSAGVLSSMLAYLLWKASGSPSGAEQYIIGLLSDRWRRNKGRPQAAANS